MYPFRLLALQSPGIQSEPPIGHCGFILGHDWGTLGLNYKGGYITPLCAKFLDPISPCSFRPFSFFFFFFFLFNKRNRGQQMSWGPNLGE